MSNTHTDKDFPRYITKLRYSQRMAMWLKNAEMVMWP